MSNELAKTNGRPLAESMAEEYSMGLDEFRLCLKKMAFGGLDVSNAEALAFMQVAHEYKLNPFTKQIYAMKSKGGALTPIVPIDGWLAIANRNPAFDGLELTENFEDGKLVSVTAQVYRKDRAHPVTVTEYFSECERKTEPWKQYPVRMLRHKATIQGLRYAFGLGGIFDPDEAERIEECEKTVEAKIIDASADGPQELEAALDAVTEDVIDSVADEPTGEGQDYSGCNNKMLDALIRGAKDKLGELHEFAVPSDDKELTDTKAELVALEAERDRRAEARSE